jgi:uncharacterized membrane protein YkgB
MRPRERAWQRPASGKSENMTIGLIALIIALKVTACLISLASGFRGTLLCAKVLAGIVSQEAVPAAARVAAAGILLDRGWGKAIQPQAAEKKAPAFGLASAPRLWRWR